MATATTIVAGDNGDNNCLYLFFSAAATGPTTQPGRDTGTASAPSKRSQPTQTRTMGHSLDILSQKWSKHFTVLSHKIYTKICVEKQQKKSQNENEFAYQANLGQKEREKETVKEREKEKESKHSA